MRINIFLLSSIVLLAIVLRLPFLDKFPNGFSGDEAGIGYSAYSILKTGKDEWGKFLPITLRSFGDFKPAFYTYLTIPAIAIFGLNEFATRLPAVIIGVFSVIVTYFLTLELFRRKSIALLSAFFLAISPWHIHFSRTAFEGGLTTLLFPAGLLFYLKGVKDGRFLALGFLVWGLNLFSYLPARMFTLLMVIVVLFIKQPSIRKLNFYIRLAEILSIHTEDENKRIQTSQARLIKLKKTPAFQAGEVYQILSLIIIVFFAILLILSTNKTTASRFSDISIFNTGLESLKKIQFESTLPGQLPRVFDNKITYYSGIFVDNYLSYFSTTFLFTGQRPSESYLNLAGIPLLYGIDILLLLFAFSYLVKKPTKANGILIAWLLLAPIPAALTQGSLNANRTITFLPVFSILTAVGAVKLVDFLTTLNWFHARQKLLYLSLTATFSISCLYFLENYFINLPKKPSESIRFGYKEVISYTEGVKDKYDKIIFSKSSSVPEAFVSFYTKVDPKFRQTYASDYLRYEKEGKRYLDQLESYSLGKYTFSDIEWNRDKKSPNTLMVGKPEEFPENVSGVKAVYTPSGKMIFRIVESEVKTND